MKLTRAGGSLIPTAGILVALFLVAATLHIGEAAPKRRNKKKAKKKEEKIEVPMRDIEVAEVDEDSLASVILSAERIDRLVEKNYAKYDVRPNEMTTDAQFVRRVYLDITGTIPEYRAAKFFVRSRIDDKRSRLIDKLLNSKGYASNFYNYWGDILRVTDRLTNNVSAVSFNEWIKVSLEENKPYDEFVYEMLSATGDVWENPPAGYYIRDTGMPLANMNNTIRVFLGTRIGCAQCHDHPFDKWTQKDFYEIAAYTYPVRTRVSARDKKRFGGKNIVAKMKAELRKIDENFRGGGKYNRMLNGNLYEVFDAPYRKLRLPDDYAYDDAEPKSIVQPSTLFGEEAQPGKGHSPREAFARWVVSEKNPRFAKTIANRLWKKLMGVGLIEPDDDIRDDTVAENEELMQYLTDEMIRVDFDMKEFLRILMHTKTYQRQASRKQVNPGDEYHFPGPVLRRMTAEQVWDSFITLATFKPEDYQGEPADVKKEFMHIDLAKATPEQVFENYKKFQANRRRKVRNARDKSRTHKGMLLARASELPMPVPPGHFLRKFGQSDRELIQTSSTDGSVPQILEMFNGTVTHMILDKRSKMFDNVVSERRESERINVIFLSILSRMPTERERRIAEAEIEANGAAGYGNVIWALVNTREFLFIQ